MSWIKISKLKEEIGISRHTINKWLDMGLPVYQIGRCRLVKTTDLDEFIEMNGKIKRGPAKIVNFLP